ncbi:hypothetical protein E2562_029625 [Oryza meyeriana var. granulata]|uniref:Uncharacterized protein n=1 Tax=Oryza meyeriana var. granulata TaxID=110450 RepID=A0A6G1E4L7_9ORYZ|nr:hypothetical protein E2562_029625 [Oryza meyeriana var. granulata]
MDGVSPCSQIGHPVLGGGGGFLCSMRKSVDQWLRQTQLAALRWRFLLTNGDGSALCLGREAADRRRRRRRPRMDKANGGWA